MTDLRVSSNQTEPDFQALDEKIQAEMKRLGVPGVAVGVIHQGREYVAGFGITNAEQPLPVDGDTLFQIGSTTKTVTGTAAMRLVETGKLDLETPLREYLPDFRLQDETVAARATLRHLFTHTGGWVGDYFEDFGRGEDAVARFVEHMAELPQLTPLGEVWSYNNAGFSVAGRIIEVVTGQNYEEAIKDLVLKPLGMKNSFFFAEEAIVKRVAVGHWVGPEGSRVLKPWNIPRSANPAGGIISSVRDQLRYARFHLGDGTTEEGERLLKSETLAFMKRQLAPAGSMTDAVGVTWLLRDVGGTRFVGHGGATVGQMSAFQMLPERGFAITILTNAHQGRELHEAVLRWAFEHFLGLADPEVTPLEVPAEKLAEYAGSYKAALADQELKPGESNQLILQNTPKGGFPDKKTALVAPPPPPVRLAFYADDKIIALDSPFKGGKGEFLRDSEGKIVWFRFGGRIHRKAGT